MPSQRLFQQGRSQCQCHIQTRPCAPFRGQGSCMACRRWVGRRECALKYSHPHRPMQSHLQAQQALRIVGAKNAVKKLIHTLLSALAATCGFQYLKLWKHRSSLREEDEISCSWIEETCSEREHNGLSGTRQCIKFSTWLTRLRHSSSHSGLTEGVQPATRHWHNAVGICCWYGQKLQAWRTV
jgi:hypothetical protein